jgi:glycine/D-amino acid oxidase-like deaminating enzyme
MPLLERLGAENLREIGQTVASRGIDCDFSPTGELYIARVPWQLAGQAEEAAAVRAFGHDAEVLDAAVVRRELDSPLFFGGLRYADGNAMVEPSRLAWGLRRACLETGLRIAS